MKLNTKDTILLEMDIIHSQYDSTVLYLKPAGFSAS